jgi:hypothetical protein
MDHLRGMDSFAFLIKMPFKDYHPHSISFPPMLSHLLNPLPAAFVRIPGNFISSPCNMIRHGRSLSPNFIRKSFLIPLICQFPILLLFLLVKPFNDLLEGRLVAS